MGAAQSQAMSSAGAERRRATVVYAIVSGCDAILEQFDPEHADRAIAGIKEAVAEVINAHGGILDRCNNEEMVALFGVPASYEDDFVRAARAALALRDRITELSRDVEEQIGHPLRVYAAINSGPLVARLADDGRYSVSGEPLQIASRLAGRADAGEILVGPETQRLIAPFFTLEEKGSFSLGAKARPVVVHRVTGETGVRTRLEAAEAFGLTRHTGRERELTELNSMLERTLAGEGHFVTVAGDAGIGKSRLLLEFRRRLDERQIPLLVGRCQPNKRNIPYLPFIEVLTDLLKLREEPSAEGLRATAISGIEAIDENLAAYIPVYLHLLSIQSDEHKLAADLKGDHLTHSILEALSAIITLSSRRQPSVVVLEDWHWADEASEEAVRRLASLAPSYPLMVIVSFRPERMLDWGYVDARTIQLSPFDELSTVVVLRSILDAREVPAGLVRLLYNRTGGNPFFIEEVCRTLIESGRIRVTKGIARVEGRISDLDLPETVQAVIRTRLDRLDPDSQRVLRYASIIGREFSLPLLERIADGGGQTSSSLEMLQKHGLIQQIRVLPERVYRFRHVLTQEVAYDSLLLHQRKGLHQAAGEAIEHLYSDRIEEQLELLVHHYSSAEDWERAARFGVDSADKASGLSRFADALTMLERSEAWLMKLPDGAERKQKLVRLLLKQERLAETLVLRDRQQLLIDRLLSILDPVADRGLFADVLVRQGELFTLLSRFDEAERALAEALSIHREIDNASGERVALRMMGFLRWQQGKYEESEECNRTALSIDLAQDDRAGYAQDLTNLGSVLRGTGRLEEGLRCLEEAYRIHEEMRRPFNQVYTLDVMANLYRDLGDHDRAMEYYKRAGEIAAQHRWHLQRRFPLGAMASLAWERGRIEESLRYSRELVDAVRGLGLKHDLARALATLSHRLLESQREAEALPFLREAADIFRDVGDKDGEARTLTSVAYVSGRSGGAAADSLAIWERVRVLRRELSDSAGELEALEGLAGVSRLQSDKQELALQYLDQAWQLAVALDDSARQGDLLNTMGIVEWNRGNYSSAAEHYRRALDVFRNAGDQVHAGLMLNSLAVTMARLARSSEATELLQEALTSHRATGQRLLEGHALAALGDIHAANSQYRQALDCYSDSLEIRKAIGDRRGEGWMLYQIARVSVKTEAADQAADLLVRASAIASEIGDNQLSSACALLDQTKIEKE
jgi:tetratricopeptide (TPR) repeat protein/class 3 adenylate cyclase